MSPKSLHRYVLFLLISENQLTYFVALNIYSLLTGMIQSYNINIISVENLLSIHNQSFEIEEKAMIKK